jgi:hypothetical protein
LADQLNVRGVKVKKLQLIKIAGLLIAGLLVSTGASAYYVSGSTVYDSSNVADAGKYTYLAYYTGIGLPTYGTYDGYLGDLYAPIPPAGISKGTIGTPYLVDDNYEYTNSGGYVNNAEEKFTVGVENVHWYRFTASLASILDVYYEWGGDVGSFSLELFEYGGSDTPIETAYFSSTGPHLDVLNFTSIAAGEYLIKIVGSASGTLNNYSVFLGATPVPLPPAALLFISALAGFGVIGRKRASKAVS